VGVACDHVDVGGSGTGRLVRPRHRRAEQSRQLDDVPSAVAIAMFATIGTWFVAKYGLRGDDRDSS
jgi:hypothetical protein